MANKFETLEALKGSKILNLNDYLTNQQDRLSEIKREFTTPNRNGAINDKTENAFFNAKEQELEAQKKFIERWLKHMELSDYIGNYDISLMVVEKK
jgi:hypothetical protein